MRSLFVLRYRRLLLAFSTFSAVTFIFFHSLMSGEASGEVSGGLFLRLEAVLGWLPFFDHALLRKIAHFLEYALLGIHAPLYAVLWRRGVIVSSMLCLLVPLLDEGIQYFVPGRAASLQDALLDTAGALFGCICTVAVLLMLNRRRKNEKG